MKKTLLLLSLSLNSLFAGVENTVVTCAEDFARIFPATVEEAERQVDAALASAKDQKKSLLSIPSHERTFANTVRAYDRMLKSIRFLYGSFYGGTLFAFSKVHPDVDRRTAPLDRLLEESAKLLSDYTLYEALCEYENVGYKEEAASLTDECKAFFQKTLHSFRKNGAALGRQKYEEMALLFAEEERCAKAFDNQITRTTLACEVDVEELSGLSSDFIETLPRTSEGKCKLSFSEALYFLVVPYCTNSQVREKLTKLRLSVAYPENINNLQNLLKVRRTIAKEMGYASYADYSLEDSMIGGCNQVRDFIDRIVAAVTPAAKKEWDLIIQDLPNDVVLKDGKLQPWDALRARDHYIQKHFALDMLKIREYFPFEHVFSTMLSLYESFFNVSFEKNQGPIKGLWRDDLRALVVRSKKDNRLLGNILLDLYPQKGKYPSMCCVSLGTQGVADDNSFQPGAAILIGNFPASTEQMPSLLSLEDVTTLFHEFGHAMHCVLAESSFFSSGGYASTETDFIEVPSVMLEQWVKMPDQLLVLSCHYKNGSRLSDELVKKIISMNLFGRADFEMDQAGFGRVSLNFHDDIDITDLDAASEASSCYLDSVFSMNPQMNSYASFGHLSEYKTSYYCYAYARVCAAELFAKLKEEGLYADGAGRAYVDALLRPGVDKGGITRLSNFLGRAPSYEAFFASLREENL